MLKKISEGIGNKETLQKLMEDLGYSKSYAKSPIHLKETDSWQALLNEQIPDELLTKVHRGLLINKNWRARDAGLDKGYKLKNKYGAIVIQHKLGNLSDEDIEGEIAGVLSEAIRLATREKKKD